MTNKSIAKDLFEKAYQYAFGTAQRNWRTAFNCWKEAAEFGHVDRCFT